MDPHFLQGKKKELHERQDILKKTTIKGYIRIKKYGKRLLVQIKEEEAYKIITNKAFTEDEDSPFKKIEPHKKFNTQWGTIYSRNLAEFTKESYGFTNHLTRI